MPDTNEQIRSVHEMLRARPLDERASALICSIIDDPDNRGLEGVLFLASTVRMMAKFFPIEQRLRIASHMCEQSEKLFRSMLQ